MLFWLNVIVNFAVPFMALLSGHSKQRTSALFQVSLAVLAGRWLDIHLLVAPAVSPVASVPIFTIAATGIVVAGMLLLFKRKGAPSKQGCPRRLTFPAPTRRRTTPSRARTRCRNPRER